MNQLSLSDLHCDTPFELFKAKQTIVSNSLSIDLRKADHFKEYLQIAAVWSDSRLDNNAAYERFFEIANYFGSNTKDLPDNVNFILSLEDARILNKDITRLDAIYGAGVRVITALWKGETCIGGSYDTSIGLSDFGISVIRRCLEMNIVVDISHASRHSAEDIFDLIGSKMPVIASHSDAYSVTPHPRNLSDALFERVKISGGVIGINLCSEHLGITDNTAPVCTILKHIEHYLSLGGEDTVCFGCDFDGAQTPAGFEDISSLYIIADEMTRLNYSSELLHKIFFTNAKKFILKNIKS